MKIKISFSDLTKYIKFSKAVFLLVFTKTIWGPKLAKFAYYDLTFKTSGTTAKPLTMLEKVQKEGGLSTWNMSKRDKLSLLAQLSKAYLEKNLKRKRSIVNDVSENFNIEQRLGDLTSQIQNPTIESNENEC